jgi:hypothetical protein
MGRHEGAILLFARVSHPVKPTVEAFTHPYAAANSDEQLELRVCMHKIVLPSSLQREAELYYYRRHRKTCDLFHDFLKRSSIQMEELLCTVQL